MANDERNQMEAQVLELEKRLLDVSRELERREEWKAANAFVEEARKQLSQVSGMSENEWAALREDLQRQLTFHSDSMDLVLEVRRREQQSRRVVQKQRWATEKDRLQKVKSQYLRLKILMVLSWTCALGLGLSFETLAILALAPAAIGCLDVRGMLFELAPEKFAAEREEMLKTRSSLWGWLTGFVAAALVAVLLVVLNSTVFK